MNYDNFEMRKVFFVTVVKLDKISEASQLETYSISLTKSSLDKLVWIYLNPQKQLTGLLIWPCFI